MPRRRGARKLALDILYEHELTETPIEETLARHLAAPGFEFAAALVRSVLQHQEELDKLIGGYAEQWSIDRMPVIDRNLLRMGACEILYIEDVPAAVTINEAVELAKTYSTEDSPRFINGILGHLTTDRGE
jgi:transcription antitermination protein NusB